VISKQKQYKTTRAVSAMTLPTSQEYTVFRAKVFLFFFFIRFFPFTPLLKEIVNVFCGLAKYQLTNS
jgi:hypothetical protein